MLISMLKFKKKKKIKILPYVSIIKDHHQGVFCTSLKLLVYLKNTEFKILKINPCVMVAIL